MRAAALSGRCRAASLTRAGMRGAREPLHSGAAESPLKHRSARHLERSWMRKGGQWTPQAEICTLPDPCSVSQVKCQETPPAVPDKVVETASVPVVVPP